MIRAAVHADRPHVATARARGFTLIELMIVVAIVGVIATIAVPTLVRARMSANEAAAIGSLRAVHSAQATFSSSCATGFYAIALDDLAKAPAGSTAAFISPDLSTNGVLKSGYLVTLARSAEPGTRDQMPVATCNAAANTPASAYFATAAPLTVGQTGRRYFATDTRATVFEDTAAAIANPIPAGTAVVQE